ncbi:hypothetical protein A1351_08785 [Methylosinus sp. R-45379]|uniref:hypothetical protein n=1 Tax=Methylosinus sp. R-45379 TaxID=980563 RepID=UPI0007C9196E|nr:hypothetical protein [Methylosinus sp. R-45379]OAI30461.1 hypothetical protein A1351_08785 [Methylosinus sp. R-45379]
MIEAEFNGTSPHPETMKRNLEDLGCRGILSDYPTKEKMPVGSDPIPENIRCGEPAQKAKPQKKPRHFLPLPDGFVTELMQFTLWFHGNLAEQLIECWIQLKHATEKARERGISTSDPRIVEKRHSIIEAMDWRDVDGNPLQSLPWPIRLREGLASVSSTSWPPREASAINQMISILQALNFCIVALCTGARMGEVLSATDASIDSAGEGRYGGRTFKLYDEVEGKERDWPLHPAAEKALLFQKQIASVLRPPHANHLWVTTKGSDKTPAGSLMLDFSGAIVSAVDQLGMTELAGGARAHAHRWRHTVGRLVALAIVEAPAVLMDLFGHRDPEMTLTYMLSKPDFAKEVMEVAEEVSYALAGEAISDVENGVAGGSAAATLAKGLEAFRMQRGIERFDVETLREAIEILTFGGRSWQMIRPGVLCTKQLGEFGPCTKGRGEPDPGACRTSCDHRLEMARARDHCEQSIDVLLRELAAAEAEGAEMVAASIEGQILANLKRWDDVRERILARNDVARRIWNSRHDAMEAPPCTARSADAEATKASPPQGEKPPEKKRITPAPRSKRPKGKSSATSKKTMACTHSRKESSP